jgi:hypothetical protein
LISAIDPCIEELKASNVIRNSAFFSIYRQGQLVEVFIGNFGGGDNFLLRGAPLE